MSVQQRSLKLLRQTEFRSRAQTEGQRQHLYGMTLREKCWDSPFQLPHLLLSEPWYNPQFSSPGASKAIWAAATQLKASYQENVKGKDSFASFSFLSHSSCLVSFPKHTRCQMPKNHGIQSKVAEASETLQVSTSFLPGNGKGVSQYTSGETA